MSRGGEIDKPRIAAAVREILLAIGEDPDREGLQRTPSRIADAYEELFAGLREDPRHHLNATFDEGHKEMVVLRDIPFASLCEHHLLPFTGFAHVGYIPRGRIVGLSKLARLVEGYARRPQVQERLTSEIADALLEELNPDGCGVIIDAVHTCMTIRGVEKPGASMVTSAMRGGFRNRPETRAEFIAIVRGGRT
ncbi:MAG: GTP cyclohydrolase I FolE [Chloroflexota bacterium]|nr:GTP cyclohydrolase I FolE [Chloroflexia bacterium]MDQ3226105.1 GTP cyclohydrolase I FolE [Chloroflexota bacterium]